MSVLNRISNFIYGSSCLGCGFYTEKLDPWLCPSCKEELINFGKEPRFFNENVVSLFELNALTRRLVYALKYQHMPGLAGYLVRHSAFKTGNEVQYWFKNLNKPLLFVPVPLHSSRYRERGYNQTEKIAYAMAAETQGRVFRGLYRNSFRESQTKLSGKERKNNVAGAFYLKKTAPEDKIYVVVDDVYTTGSTTKACEYALCEKKQLEVKICTLLYEKKASASLDLVADSKVEWKSNGGRGTRTPKPYGGGFQDR